MVVVVVVNVAVTDVLPFTVTLHGFAALHPPPLHPAKVDPLAGVADKVTAVPEE